MKTIFALAALPLVLVLGACSEAAEEDAPAEAVVADDDNDAPEPVAAPVAEDEPHDESVPHDH